MPTNDECVNQEVRSRSPHPSETHYGETPDEPQPLFPNSTNKYVGL